MGTSAAAYGIFPRRYSRSLCLVGPSPRSVSALAREEHAFVLTFRVPVTWRVPWRKQSLCAPSRSLSPPQGEVATSLSFSFLLFYSLLSARIKGPRVFAAFNLGGRGLSRVPRISSSLALPFLPLLLSPVVFPSCYANAGRANA